jgi:MFS transporter, putative metabolite:H+ symporter
MLDRLDTQARLTRRQRKLIVAATFGMVLEFLDYFLVGFVLTFVARPWGLTVWTSSAILLSSGVGAVVGAFVFGRLADRIGRRPVFLQTLTLFSVASAALALTPESPVAGPVYLVVFRFLIGLGAGGLYCVDLPLVQEYMPTRLRGRVSGMITAAVPIGFLLGSVLTAVGAPLLGWRGLFVVVIALSLVALALRAWIPESPYWLLRQGRAEDARRSVAWALEVVPETLPLAADVPPTQAPPFRALFAHPRSVAVSWLTNLGAQAGYYGLALWAPALIVAILHVTPARAASLMLWVTLAGLVGRLLVAWMSERFGRRVTGAVTSFGAAAAIVLTAYAGDAELGVIPALVALLMLANLLCDGQFAVVGPYAAEVWPASLRTTGMGSAYGFGGLGKVIGPLGMALVVDSPALFSPAPNPVALEPAFLYFAAWYVLAGAAFLLFGFETRSRSITEIDAALRPAAPKEGVTP